LLPSAARTGLGRRAFAAIRCADRACATSMMLSSAARTASRHVSELRSSQIITHDRCKAPSPRSGRQHKAWGASPRLQIKMSIQARDSGRQRQRSRPLSRAQNPLVRSSLSWGLRPRLYAAVRFADWGLRHELYAAVRFADWGLCPKLYAVLRFADSDLRPRLYAVVRSADWGLCPRLYAAVRFAARTAALASGGRILSQAAQESKKFPPA